LILPFLQALITIAANVRLEIKETAPARQTAASTESKASPVNLSLKPSHPKITPAGESAPSDRNDSRTPVVTQTPAKINAIMPKVLCLFPS
jgi:hypothetical protein